MVIIEVIAVYSVVFFEDLTVSNISPKPMQFFPQFEYLKLLFFYLFCFSWLSAKSVSPKRTSVTRKKHIVVYNFHKYIKFLSVFNIRNAVKIELFNKTNSQVQVSFGMLRIN